MTSSVESTSSPPGSRSRRWPLVTALVLGLGWIAALFWLTVTSANPVTLNREQILRAEIVVIGQVEDLPEGQLGQSDDDYWPPRAPDSVTVENLAETPAQWGETYIVPLARVTGTGPGAKNRFRVVPSRLPGSPPLIYPLSVDSIEQLRALRPPTAAASSR